MPILVTDVNATLSGRATVSCGFCSQTTDVDPSVKVPVQEELDRFGYDLFFLQPYNNSMVLGNTDEFTANYAELTVESGSIRVSISENNTNPASATVGQLVTAAESPWKAPENFSGTLSIYCVADAEVSGLIG